MTLTPLLPFWMTYGVPLLWGAAWWPLVTLADDHGVLVGRRVVHPLADPEGSFPWGTTFLSPILSLHLRFLKGMRDLWRLLILSQGCKLEIRYNNKFHLLWNEISFLANSDFLKVISHCKNNSPLLHIKEIKRFLYHFYKIVGNCKELRECNSQIKYATGSHLKLLTLFWKLFSK